MSSRKSDKRLIEDFLPIQAISAEASREKSVRKGHISTLHLWWARRPLVACRAAVYGALVPASRFIPENGPDNKKQSLGRANAARFMKRLCRYPSGSKPEEANDIDSAIKEAQKHILEAHAERLTREMGRGVTIQDIEEGRAPRPKVLDMFAGGGAIPLEALRLGCDAYALDLNPVAHIIELCTLVYPQKYGKPDPEAPGMTGPKNDKGETTWGGLANEVRYWGDWVLKKVKSEIGDLYPLIPDPDYKGKRAEIQTEMWKSSDEKSMPAGYLMPVAYLWTRTVRCKNPLCGATVPLVKQTWLCKKKGRFVALKMIAPKGGKKVRFKIIEACTEEALGFDPSAGSEGGNATCPFCGTVADSEYVKDEARAARMGQQFLAIAAVRKKKKGKIYLSEDLLSSGILIDESTTRDRLDKIFAEKGIERLDEIIEINPRSMDIDRAGFSKWNQIFTNRQQIALLSLCDSVKSLNHEMISHGYNPDYIRAVVSMLGCGVSKFADFCSTLCVFNYTGGRGVKNSFPQQSLPMVWDFAETNPFNPAGASWIAVIEDNPAVIEQLEDIHMAGNVQRGTALKLTFEGESVDAVITDPPYYDNVSYSNLSDFFLLWLRRSIGHLYPEHFASSSTPKKQEIIAAAYRHRGNRNSAKVFYEEKMHSAFSEAYRVLKTNGQMTVVYAHKTTLGWATLVDALRRSGFTVTEAWPLDTERKGRVIAMDTAALASSIFLVARKRGGSSIGSYEEEVRPELDQIVRERVDSLWKMGIAGADLIIAAVGAGLRAFTRFSRVEYANGEEVPAEKFLAEVEGVVLETLLEKIFGVTGSGVAGVDGPSRFYVLWRYAYKAAEMDAGEAIVFTYGQNVELDGPTGLSSGSHALVEKKKGKYRLRDFSERGGSEKLGMPKAMIGDGLQSADGSIRADRAGAPAPLIDILHRVLWILENEPRSLNGFLDDVRPDRERLRLLAQVLAGTALAGKKEDGPDHSVATTPAEAAALNKLVANWRSLMEQPFTVRETLFEYMRNSEVKK